MNRPTACRTDKNCQTEQQQPPPSCPPPATEPTAATLPRRPRRRHHRERTNPPDAGRTTAKRAPPSPRPPSTIDVLPPPTPEHGGPPPAPYPRPSPLAGDLKLLHTGTVARRQSPGGVRSPAASDRANCGPHPAERRNWLELSGGGQVVGCGQLAFVEVENPGGAFFEAQVG